MRRALRLVSVAVALLLAALTLACFDAPIRQGLRIFFNADGSAEIHATTTFREEWSDTDQPGVRQRLDEARDAILHGEDLWARAFRSMEPRRERVTYDYADGRLTGSSRQAVVDDPEEVVKLFAGTAVGAFVEREGGEVTLDLVPGGSGGATQRQRRQVDEALESFSRAVADHLEALAALYEWLEDRPEATPRAIRSLLGVRDPAGERGERSGAEASLIEEAERTGGMITGILTIDRREAYTLDELSRLVHDPFPSPVVIEVEGEVRKVTGFLRQDGRRFATRSHGLWDALDSLRGRWVAPLPMVEAVAALRGQEPGVEVDEERLLEEVLSIPRAVHRVPSAAEVKEALVEEMTPPDLYRLRWTLPAEAE